MIKFLSRKHEKRVFSSSIVKRDSGYYKPIGKEIVDLSKEE
jgi:hypothetical protein